MSQVQEFFNKVESDSIVTEEYKTLLLSCKELSKDEAIQKVIGFAQEKGYTFSVEDIESFAKAKESDELSEEDLDAVAGGLSLGLVIKAHDGSHGTICFIFGGELVIE